jgi:hypothetical protein
MVEVEVSEPRMELLEGSDMVNGQRSALRETRGDYIDLLYARPR